MLRCLRSGCALALAAVTLCGMACEPRRTEPEAAPSLGVRVLADTGRSQPLRATLSDSGLGVPLRAAVWLTRVQPAAGPDLPPPQVEPTPIPPDETSRPKLEVDPDLKPPLLHEPGPELRAPRGARGTVELDVRVGEDGSVSDALWAGGSSDSTLVSAAIDCALAMRFYPALQAGKPVAVWCRQRFDFAGR